ncbi:MAG: MBL fold metallo-hydrolase [Bryobacteraceae bacterium]|nr:MBL fold metallo-hydrolase [Bryobacteraceae bacterium]MDW8376971.1 MBL fold metallo-hydrolase [Bryobacterales bacterium]
MIHEILPVGPLQCNCSIFGEESTREAIVVDPGDEIEMILAVLQRHGLRLQAIVITHAHIDHIGGAAKLKAATGAPVWMNERDQALYDRLDVQAAWLGVRTPEQTEIDHPAREGDILKLASGAGATEFHVLHTPGHTPGSLCLYLPAQQTLVAGDTLFRESIGRTDLPGGDTHQILSSIETKLFTLPEETLVIPGHGPKTTIGHEREHNPFV